MRKIAVVGARGVNAQTDDVRLRWFRWDELSKVVNLSDYDIVVLSLLTVPDQATVDWKAFYGLFSPQSVRDILGHGGRIIVVGDPRFSVVSHSPTGPHVSEQFLNWTGLAFRWDDRPGESKETVFQYRADETLYGSYLSHLRTWDYALDTCEPALSTLSEGFPDLVGRKGVECFPQVSKYVANRYGSALAFAVSIAFFKEEQGYRPARYQALLQLQPIVFLPRTVLQDDVALSTLLRDACGIAVVMPEPVWVEGMVAPDQEIIDADLQQILAEHHRLLALYQTKEAERAVIRKPLRLLYDMGSSLEEVVLDTLRGLGAQVEEPDTPGKEDGWVTVNVDGTTCYGVLEVKGTRNNEFGEGGLRQVAEWQQRGRERRRRKFKGIFIGNNAVDRPPAERPPGFSKGFVETAKLQEVVALKSEDLYLLYELRIRGLVNFEAFWRDVFATEGIFDAAWYRMTLDQARTS